MSEENNRNQKIVFAGGCFWCTEASFNPEFGVVSATSGYIGGHIKNPNYSQVSSGDTGAVEVVEVVYNPENNNFKRLLVNFWKGIDPTDAGGQFADQGSQYHTGIYYFNEEQKKLAEESKQILENSKKFSSPIVVPIIDGTNLDFTPAEEYHQKYAEKNELHYNMYKKGSGRAGFIHDNWENDHTFDEFVK